MVGMLMRNQNGTNAARIQTPLLHTFQHLAATDARIDQNSIAAVAYVITISITPRSQGTYFQHLIIPSFTGTVSANAVPVPQYEWPYALSIPPNKASTAPKQSPTKRPLLQNQEAQSKNDTFA